MPVEGAGWCWGRMWGVTPSRDRRAGLETANMERVLGVNGRHTV
jgi:hypothetical protein